MLKEIITVGFPDTIPNVRPSMKGNFGIKQQQSIDKVFNDNLIVNVIEIGAGIGLATQSLALKVLGTLVCVDTWNETDSYETFCVNCWALRLKAIPIMGPSDLVLAWAAPKLRAVDLIYFTDERITREILDICQRMFPSAILAGGSLLQRPALEDFANHNGFKLAHNGEAWFILRG